MALTATVTLVPNAVAAASMDAANQLAEVTMKAGSAASTAFGDARAQMVSGDAWGAAASFAAGTAGGGVTAAGAVAACTFAATCACAEIASVALSTTTTTLERTAEFTTSLATGAFASRAESPAADEREDDELGRTARVGGGVEARSYSSQSVQKTTSGTRPNAKSGALPRTAVCFACTRGLCGLLVKPFKRQKCPSGALARATSGGSNGSLNRSRFTGSRQFTQEGEGPWSKPIQQWSAAQVKESWETLLRHKQQAAWHPTVLLYDASTDPPPFASCDRRPRRAFQLPLNASEPLCIDNENFLGSFLFLHRLPQGSTAAASSSSSSAPAPPPGEANPCEAHFAGKSRRWEARVQGRFKCLPQNKLYTGCILEDFDYSGTFSWSASILQATFVPLMEMVMGEKFYFSWGTRGDDADQEGAELATIVTNLAGVDQVIWTRAGELVPPINGDIDGVGLCRNQLATSVYRRKVQEVIDNLNTKDTYTFCVWGCSRYINVMNSAFEGVFPGLGPISYAGFLDEWPAHFVLYGLQDDEKDPRHVETKKTYYVDVMVWSSDMSLPKLPQRYGFRDSRSRKPTPA